MLKRIFKNNYFIAALLIIFVTLSATVGWTVVGDTDAYFSDSDTGAGKGSSGNIGIAITNIETDFSDSFDEAEPMYWGSIADFSFSVENQKTIAVDLETTVTVSSEESLNLELLLPAVGIYNKSDVSIVNEVPVLNDGAVPVGTKEVVDGNMVFTLPNRTLSGSEEQPEGQIVWKNSGGSVISNAAYQKLSSSEKNKYTKCGDSDTYDLVFVFDGSASTMANFSFKTEINGVKQGNSLGWKSSTDFTKYGSVGYNPYKGILEAGPDFNDHIRNMGYEYKSITFTDVAIPNDAVTTDVSYAKDGSVLAWSASTTSTNEDSGIMVSTIDGGPMYANWDCSYMFSNMGPTLTFDENFDSSLTENMSHMFDGYTKNSVDLSAWTAENVTDMSYMFANTAKAGNPHHVGLASIEFGEGFKENKVTNMSHMFDGFRDYTSSLDITKLGTSTVENMSYMFANTSYSTGTGYEGLKSLNISGMDTSSATDMSYMFYKCSYISELDVSSFDTSNVQNMAYMFYELNHSTIGTNNWIGPSVLNVSNFVTTEVTDMSYMFYGCGKIKTLDVSNFSTPKVTDMQHMFDGCYNLGSLNLGKFITTEVTNMQYMFNGCYALTTIGTNQFDTSKVTDMQYMFYGCYKLTSIDVSGWLTPEVTNMAYMFSGCSSLTTIGENQFNTEKVTSMSYMFQGCSKLTSLDAKTWNTSNVTDMSRMFYSCGSLTTLNVNSFDTTKLTTGKEMFYGCSSLKELILNNWNTSNMTDMSYMFYNCKALTKLDLNGWNTSNVENMSYMFYGNNVLPKLNVNHFNVKKVTNTSYMFYDLQQLRELDLSSWVFNNNFKADYMFYGNCIAYNSEYRGFRTIYASDWSSLITSTGAVFGNSYALVGDNVAFGSSTFGKEVANPTTGYFSTKPELVSNMLIPGYELNNILPYEVKKVVFTNVVDTTKTTTDLSVLGDGSVVGWYDNTTYYIASVDGNKIIAHPTSSDMFRSKSSLTTVDFTNLDGSLIKNMEYMFMSCSALTNVNIDSINITNNLSTRYMFAGCSALKVLDVASWDVSKLSSAYGMFQNCSSMVMIYADDWSSISNPQGTSMFINCSKLSGAIAFNSSKTGWNYANTTTGYFTKRAELTTNMLADGRTLSAIIPSTATAFMLTDAVSDTVQTTDLSALKDGSVVGWLDGTTYYVAPTNGGQIVAHPNSAYMFNSKTSLKTIDLMNLDVSKVSNAMYMFYGCTALTTIYAGDWTEIVTPISSEYMFYNCSKLVGMVNYSSSRTTWVYANTTEGLFTNKNDLSVNMLMNGPSLNALVPSTATSVVFTDTVSGTAAKTDLSVFGDGSVVGWSSGSTYYIASVDGNKIIAHPNSSNMFKNKTSLRTVDFTNLDSSKVLNMSYLFNGCTALSSVNFETLDTTNVNNAMYMFYKCSALTSLDMSNFTAPGTTSMFHMFDGCSKLTTIDMSNFVGTPTVISYMFQSCSALTTVDLTGWDVSEVINSSYMFNGCSNLQTIYGDDWTSVTTPTNSSYMFNGCSKLVGAIPYDSSKIHWAYANQTTGYFTVKVDNE